MLRVSVADYWLTRIQYWLIDCLENVHSCSRLEIPLRWLKGTSPREVWYEQSVRVVGNEAHQKLVATVVVQYRRETWIITGYYEQTFKQILENAFLWAAAFLANYRMKRVDNLSPMGVNKRQLNDFCQGIPVVEKSIVFIIWVEADKLTGKTEDDGHHLVQFGNYRDMCWRALSESNKADHVRFIWNFILRKANCRIDIKMEQFRQYCLQHENAKHQPSQCYLVSVSVLPHE